MPPDRRYHPADVKLYKREESIFGNMFSETSQATSTNEAPEHTPEFSENDTFIVPPDENLEDCETVPPVQSENKRKAENEIEEQPAKKKPRGRPKKIHPLKKTKKGIPMEVDNQTRSNHYHMNYVVPFSEDFGRGKRSRKQNSFYTEEVN